MMGFQKLSLAVMALLAPAALIMMLPASRQGDGVSFPEKFSEGVLYAGIDRPDIKQYRELFASAAAIAAAKRGEPLPDGAVLTLVQYAAQRDARGNLRRDGDGHLIKGEIVGYSVMEKHRGWGAVHAPDLRNGEWEFQTFTADGEVNPKANLTDCLTCHKTRGAHDFVFSDGQMRAARLVSEEALPEK